MNKKFNLIIILGLFIYFSSCDNIRRTYETGYADTQDLKKALEYFIEDNKYMTERDALAKEIDYYREPNILRQEYIGTLTGKNLIHIANEIQKEDGNQMGWGPSNIKIFRKVDDIKELGINYPNEQKAKVFVFGGDFVHYAKGIKEIYKIIVYIPDLNRFLDVDGKYINEIYTEKDLNSKDYKWFWDLPIYNDKPL